MSGASSNSRRSPDTEMVRISSDSSSCFKEVKMNSEKNWHKTLNNQIIDLNLFESFWVEELPNSEWHVFGKDKYEVDWRLAEFKGNIAAKAYLNCIYGMLEKLK